MYEYLKQLYDHQLWTNLYQLGPLALTICANGQLVGHTKDSGNAFVSPPASTSAASSVTPASFSSSSDDLLLTSRQRLHVTVMLADACLECKEYRKAEALYKESLQYCKHLNKSKSSSKDSAEERMSSDAEIKYKLHQCFLATQQHSQAINILQSIPAKQRTPKTSMALGKLFQRAGMERPAVTCFKEVLKACPMSLEAAQLLLQLGVKAKEIQELTLEATMGNPAMDWFGQWIQAQASLASRDYTTAIQSFKQLEDRSLLRNELGLLVSLGQAQYYHGDMTSACATLHRVQRLDPNNLRGMDCLAAILCKERKGKELESLATRLMAITEEAAEPWVAMGYYCYLNKKGTRAVYFAHKACMVNQRSVEALLLKGNVLLDLKKLQDAMNHFREAMLIGPYRYELHKGLVDCYLAQNRHREAVSVAATACKQLSNSARALTLFASVLMKDPFQLSLNRAKTLLEKALASDPCHLPAVYMLSDVLEQEAKLDMAISLLKKQLVMQSTCKLHQMLADLLAKTHEEEQAMEHYTLALNLDPKNATAQEGLQKIEHSSDGALEAGYDLEMEDMNSDDGDDLEESETEAVWSDGDLNLAPSNASF